MTSIGDAIAEPDLADLFEPLKRRLAVEDREKTERSLGLGQFIVPEIAKAHGGQVAVHSDQARTTFSVLLPRH